MLSRAQSLNNMLHVAVLRDNSKMSRRPTFATVASSRAVLADVNRARKPVPFPPTPLVHKFATGRSERRNSLLRNLVAFGLTSSTA